MDQMTAQNILSMICEKAGNLSWKIKCQYADGINPSIMKVSFLESLTKKRKGEIVFELQTGKVLRGHFKNGLSFEKGILLTDALLEILHAQVKYVPVAS